MRRKHAGKLFNKKPFWVVTANHEFSQDTTGIRKESFQSGTTVSNARKRIRQTVAFDVVGTKGGKGAKRVVFCSPEKIAF